MSSEVNTNHYAVYNEKVLANGAWITNEFLQDVISQEENENDIEVVGSEMSAAVGQGDNYLSIIYRMATEFVRRKSGRKECRKFVIKGPPKEQFLRTLIEDCGIFRKELYMYKECLPAMRKLMEDHMPEEDFIAAYTYKCNLPNVIVMEDLKVSGYKMADRRKMLDFAHSSRTLRSLARLHALSAKLVKIRPEVVEEVSRNEMYSDDRRSHIYPHMVLGARSWLKVMAEQEVTRPFVPVIERVTEKFMNKISYVVKPHEGFLMTLNHGDSWSNNFLYRYDKEGNVAHAKLVDFQLSRFASPVLDILYFLFSSTQPDMLSERISDLIQIYHEALVSDMEKMGLDPLDFPSLSDIRKEMKRESIFGVMALMVITPIVVAKPSDVADMENLDLEKQKENPETYAFENNFRDPYYQELVVKYMGVMERMGYLRSAEELTVPAST